MKKRQTMHNACAKINYIKNIFPVDFYTYEKEKLAYTIMKAVQTSSVAFVLTI